MRITDLAEKEGEARAKMEANRAAPQASSSSRSDSKLVER